MLVYFDHLEEKTWAPGKNHDQFDGKGRFYTYIGKLQLRFDGTKKQ